MTDKEKIRKEIVRLQKKLSFGSNIDDACILELQNVLTYIDSLQEESKFKVGQYLKQGDTIVRILEVSDNGYHCDSAFIPFSAQNQWELVKDPVSESLNTESMIESYKQRLIPQVNGMKNSPLVDMCLTSYKHGINETLDTLNLSNVQRKNCKELKDPVSELWHDASEEPADMSHCLIYYGCKESVGHYLHYESALYNKKEKMFVTSSFPHPTGYKVEQKSLDGGCVAEVYKDRRDRISISDITQWCYLHDLHKLPETIKNYKDPASEGRDIFDNCLKSEEKFILPQKISGNINCENCLYSSACALGDIQECIIDKPVSEDLEEASKKWLIPKLDKSYAIYGEAKMMELTRFDGYAMLDAIEFGAKWGRNQAITEIQAQSMALAHGCPKESVSDDLEKACWKAREKYDAKIPFSKYMFKAGAKWKKEESMAKAIDATCFGFQDAALFSFRLPAGSYLVGSKVKVVIIKED